MAAAIPGLGLTLLQLLQIAGAAGTVVKTGMDIAHDLQSEDATGDTKLSPDHLARLHAALAGSGLRLDTDEQGMVQATLEGRPA